MDLLDPGVEIAPGITQGGALNALQLAAKLHELILVASLGNIVTHMAHHNLVGDQGLPLGMLANGFAIGSGDYLRTKAYWSSIMTGKAHYWRFWLLSLLATILATLAGPSSAIAVIPSLNWFPINEPFINDVFPLYVYNQSTVLWPDTLTKASTNTANSGIDCVNYTLFTHDQDSCPAGGFRDVSSLVVTASLPVLPPNLSLLIAVVVVFGLTNVLQTYQWAGNLLFVNSTARSNVSFPDSHGDTRRVLSTQSCASDFDGRASGMSLNTFISGAMTAYWEFAQNNWEGLALKTSQPKLSLDGQIYAPKVEVMCNGNDYYNISEVNNRTHVNFPSFTPDKQLPSADFITPFHSTMNDTTFDWVRMPAGAENPAIGAIVRVPYEYRHDTAPANATNLFQATEIHVCSIYAQWIPVHVYYEPRTSDQVSFNVKGKLSDTCLSLPHEAATDQPVRNVTINQDFANAINQEIAFTDGPVPAVIAMLQRTVFQDPRVTDQVLNAFKSPFVGSAETGVSANLTHDQVRQSRATMISTLLAGVITDSLARTAGNGIFPFSPPIFLTNKTDGNHPVGRFLVSSAQGGEDEALNTTIADVGTLLQINPSFQRYGYGYRWTGSGTVQFGIIVLLIQFSIAALHSVFIFYTVVVLKQGLVSSWNTVTDLITLALNSTPSARLQDTCAGVEAAKTWRQLVTVRETYPGHLEMVIGADERKRVPTGAGRKIIRTSQNS